MPKPVKSKVPATPAKATPAKATAAPPKTTAATAAPPKAVTRTLAIDIGGTGLKACLLDGAGNMISERVKSPTPEDCPPAQMIKLLAELVAALGDYERVSVGFPGVVRKGVIRSAANLGEKPWLGFDLATALEKRFKRPVRVLNDADVQGLGAIAGKGVELVITLGTGFGSSLFEDGRLSVHLELAHHPFRKGETYEEQLGKLALKKVGPERWNRRLALAIETLRGLTHFDHLYIGGGNAKAVQLKLPSHISLVSNEMGMRGGIWLWEER